MLFISLILIEKSWKKKNEFLLNCEFDLCYHTFCAFAILTLGILVDKKHPQRNILGFVGKSFSLRICKMLKLKNIFFRIPSIIFLYGNKLFHDIVIFFHISTQNIPTHAELLKKSRYKSPFFPFLLYKGDCILAVPKQLKSCQPVL